MKSVFDYHSPGKTSLHPSELVTEICIPNSSMAKASDYRRIDRTVVDVALVSAASAIRIDRHNVLDYVAIAGEGYSASGPSGNLGDTQPQLRMRPRPAMCGPGPSIVLP